MGINAVWHFHLLFTQGCNYRCTPLVFSGRNYISLWIDCWTNLTWEKCNVSLLLYAQGALLRQNRTNNGQFCELFYQKMNLLHHAHKFSTSSQNIPEKKDSFTNTSEVPVGMLGLWLELHMHTELETSHPLGGTLISDATADPTHQGCN